MVKNHPVLYTYDLRTERPMDIQGIDPSCLIRGQLFGEEDGSGGYDLVSSL
jgi:hypothetical protein